MQPLEQESTSLHSAKDMRMLAYLIVVFVVVVVSLGVFLALALKQDAGEVLEPNDFATTTIDEESSATGQLGDEPLEESGVGDGWRVYENLGVQFLYPADFVLQESDDGRGDVASFEYGASSFTFLRYPSEPANELPFDQTDYTETINSVTWKVVTPDQTVEFCDAGSCGRTRPTYYMYRDGYRYSIIYSPDELRSTIEEILSTFEFGE